METGSKLGVALDEMRTVFEGIALILRQMTASLADACAESGRVSVPKLDERQVDAYNLSVLLSRAQAGRSIYSYATRRPEDHLSVGYARLFVGELTRDIVQAVLFDPERWGMTLEEVQGLLERHALRRFMRLALAPESYADVARLMLVLGVNDYGLDSNRDMIRQQFRRFATEVVEPVAERVHTKDELIPPSIISAVAELGCFGLCIPERFGGLQPDNEPDNLGMCVVTEELSRGSLGVAGSLITRPEILSKALLKGGTEAQQNEWLPQLATGEKLCAVAVTEPDFGSDVAGLKVTATPAEGGWLINGQKTWCTFGGYADVLMVLARSDTDHSKGHRGLTIFLAEKPRFEGHSFEHTQEGGGKITGRAIDTIGYRGMHSFDVFFEDYFVSDENVLGGLGGVGRGFYYQMEGFAGGRLQTAARAAGVMQAALDKALTYAKERQVFGQPIGDYQLTAWKLARMGMLTQVARQFTYDVASLLDMHKGQVEASMVKLWASREAEWVTREAMQIHGGMGYAEEYAVSRYFVDARVFSIFEGAEEVLALRVVARQVLQRVIDEQV